MYLLYSLLLTLGVVALLPRFLFDAFRHGKYVIGLRERLGELPRIDAAGRPVVWLHCVSVGEAQAARPLARSILKNYPHHLLVVSTVTLTGQRLAREAFGQDAGAVFYFPFDWAWTARRALRAVNPSLVLVMETELWPNFLRECRKRAVPVALVNGRLSARSFRRYRMIGRFIRRVVQDLSLALMQSEADAERVRALGLQPERVRLTGNVKFDISTDSSEKGLTEELRARFAFDESRPLIVAASTHAPEERILLDAFKHLRAAPDASRTRLLIAPRHPERFNEVASLLDADGLVWMRRSSAPSALDAECDVILLDSIGELRSVYPLATVVFVGGSLSRSGGHNVLEPAAAGCCVVTGPHTFNFNAIMQAFLEVQALVQLPDVDESVAHLHLSQALTELLKDDQKRLSIAESARRVIEENRGATERTLKLLSPLLVRSSFENRLGGEREDAHRDALSV